MAQKKKEAILSSEPGDIIRNAMLHRGMVQVDLADKLGMLQSSISGSVNRKRMSLSVFNNMLDAMDFDVAVVDRETGEVMWKVAVK